MRDGERFVDAVRARLEAERTTDERRASERDGAP